MHAQGQPQIHINHHIKPNPDIGSPISPLSQGFKIQTASVYHDTVRGHKGHQTQPGVRDDSHRPAQSTMYVSPGWSGGPRAKEAGYRGPRVDSKQTFDSIIVAPEKGAQGVVGARGKGLARTLRLSKLVPKGPAGMVGDACRFVRGLELPRVKVPKYVSGRVLQHQHDSNADANLRLHNRMESLHAAKSK